MTSANCDPASPASASPSSMAFASSSPDLPLRALALHRGHPYCQQAHLPLTPLRRQQRRRGLRVCDGGCCRTRSRSSRRIGCCVNGGCPLATRSATPVGMGGSVYALARTLLLLPMDGRAQEAVAPCLIVKLLVAESSQDWVWIVDSSHSDLTIWAPNNHLIFGYCLFFS